MLKQKWFLFILSNLLALSLLAFPGCGKATAPTTAVPVPQNPVATSAITPPANIIAAPQPDNINPRGVAVGEECPVTLREDPASGYLWEANFDTAYIAQVSTNYTSTGTGGGDRDFQFKALKKGITSIIMLLKQPGNEIPKDSQMDLLAIDVFPAGQPLPGLITNGGPVQTSVGEQFTLTIEENSTSRYQWEPVFDSTYLQLVSSTHNQNSDTIAYQFQFRALKQGVTGVNMVLNLSNPQGIQADTVTIGPVVK
jgi:predicted secreted protein